MSPPSDAEWIAHIKESKARSRDLRSAIEELTSQVTGLRITVESFASRQAQQRAAAPLGVSDTHRNLSALSAADAQAAIESLSLWKARPALVAGFAGSLIALAVAFGLPITKEQTGAIMAVVIAALSLLASMRGRRTTEALVRAGERRGALAGPDSYRPPPN